MSEASNNDFNIPAPPTTNSTNSQTNAIPNEGRPSQTTPINVQQLPNPMDSQANFGNHVQQNFIVSPRSTQSNFQIQPKMTTSSQSNIGSNIFKNQLQKKYEISSQQFTNRNKAQQHAMTQQQVDSLMKKQNEQLQFQQTQYLEDVSTNLGPQSNVQGYSLENSTAWILSYIDNRQSPRNEESLFNFTQMHSLNQLS